MGECLCGEPATSGLDGLLLWSLIPGRPLWGQALFQVPDRQTLQVVQEPTEYQIGPFAGFDLTIPAGTEFEFVFDVGHRGTVTVGNQSYSFQGTGGAVSTQFESFSPRRENSSDR
ncbi:MAG: hypothetical protein KatS3mg115_1166 [Candidatus Poribacteria bacterium]|nr:MAG: hypothetical protein KatS3mg115_1166 [Candidatus Poribacteria bacterium]